MLTILSPAKKLSPDLQACHGDCSKPIFLSQATQLATLMKTKSSQDIAKLMDLSEDLATLNYTRYQDFASSRPTYPALFLFHGDVYQELQAASWDSATMDYSQQHLAILSGLYGLLKPRDAIQPYRLEMGVRLKNSSGANLYAFWQETVTNALNKQLGLQANPLLINLASTEYAKVVDRKTLQHPMVTINFYELKNNVPKMIGFTAKKARGAMAKFIMQNQIDTLEPLKEFTDLGYRFNKKTSTDTEIDFIRP